MGPSQKKSVPVTEKEPTIVDNPTVPTGGASEIVGTPTGWATFNEEEPNFDETVIFSDEEGTFEHDSETEDQRESNDYENEEVEEKKEEAVESFGELTDSWRNKANIYQPPMTRCKNSSESNVSIASNTPEVVIEHPPVIGPTLFAPMSTHFMHPPPTDIPSLYNEQVYVENENDTYQSAQRAARTQDYKNAVEKARLNRKKQVSTSDRSSISVHVPSAQGNAEMQDAPTSSDVIAFVNEYMKLFPIPCGLDEKNRRQNFVIQFKERFKSEEEHITYLMDHFNINPSPVNRYQIGFNDAVTQMKDFIVESPVMSISQLVESIKLLPQACSQDPPVYEQTKNHEIPSLMEIQPQPSFENMENVLNDLDPINSESHGRSYNKLWNARGRGRGRGYTNFLTARGNYNHYNRDSSERSMTKSTVSSKEESYKKMDDAEAKDTSFENAPSVSSGKSQKSYRKSKINKPRSGMKGDEGINEKVKGYINEDKKYSERQSNYGGNRRPYSYTHKDNPSDADEWETATEGSSADPGVSGKAENEASKQSVSDKQDAVPKSSQHVNSKQNYHRGNRTIVVRSRGPSKRGSYSKWTGQVKGDDTSKSDYKENFNYGGGYQNNEYNSYNRNRRGRGGKFSGNPETTYKRNVRKSESEKIDEVPVNNETKQETNDSGNEETEKDFTPASAKFSKQKQKTNSEKSSKSTKKTNRTPKKSNKNENNASVVDKPSQQQNQDSLPLSELSKAWTKPNETVKELFGKDATVSAVSHGKSNSSTVWSKAVGSRMSTQSTTTTSTSNADNSPKISTSSRNTRSHDFYSNESKSKANNEKQSFGSPWNEGSDNSGKYSNADAKQSAGDSNVSKSSTKIPDNVQPSSTSANVCKVKPQQQQASVMNARQSSSITSTANQNNSSCINENVANLNPMPSNDAESLATSAKSQPEYLNLLGNFEITNSMMGSQSSFNNDGGVGVNSSTASSSNQKAVYQAGANTSCGSSNKSNSGFEVYHSTRPVYGSSNAQQFVNIHPSQQQQPQNVQDMVNQQINTTTMRAQGHPVSVFAHSGAGPGNSTPSAGSSPRMYSNYSHSRPNIEHVSNQQPRWNSSAGSGSNPHEQGMGHYSGHKGSNMTTGGISYMNSTNKHIINQPGPAQIITNRNELLYTPSSGQPGMHQQSRSAGGNFNTSQPPPMHHTPQLHPAALQGHTPGTQFTCYPPSSMQGASGHFPNMAHGRHATMPPQQQSQQQQQAPNQTSAAAQHSAAAGARLGVFAQGPAPTHVPPPPYHHNSAQTYGTPPFGTTHLIAAAGGSHPAQHATGQAASGKQWNYPAAPQHM